MVKSKCLHSISSYKTQILAAFAGNIISLAHGAALAWLSPALLILQSNESPLDSGQISVSEASWLGSIYCFGAVFGNLLMGIISNSFGRKRALCFIALPQIAFWLLVIFGFHINYLYAGRVLAGIAGGGTFVCIPLFISEIADKRVRGSLGSILFFSVNIGIFMGFVIGANLSYQLVPRILIALPITFFILVLLFPETPQFLLSQGREECAKKSLAFYRNLNLNVKNDQQKFDEFYTELSDSTNHASQTKLSLKDFTNSDNRKAIAQGFGLVSVYILSGGFAIITYTANIFEQTGSKFDPNTSAIIVAGLQILGTYTSTLIADRIPRRVLLSMSTLGSALGLTVVGIFSFLAEKYDLSELSWIPIAGLAFGVFTGAIALYPLTFVVLAEILPQKIRPIASSFCNSFLNLVAFGILKTFPPLMIQIGLYGVMWIFVATSVLGIVFFLACLPETKGKAI